MNLDQQYDLRLPWKIKIGDTKAPRIVDRDGQPVVAFGNQARHRGHEWAWRTARAIVETMNNATLKV